MSHVTPQAPGPVEAKTKASALTAYIAGFVLFAVLTAIGNAPTSLPNWAGAVLLPLIPSLLGFLAGWLKSHRPGQLSASAVRAVQDSTAG